MCAINGRAEVRKEETFLAYADAFIPDYTASKYKARLWIGR
jgi:hypothetical protein